MSTPSAPSVVPDFVFIVKDPVLKERDLNAENIYIMHLFLIENRRL